MNKKFDTLKNIKKMVESDDIERQISNQLEKYMIRKFEKKDNLTLSVYKKMKTLLASMKKTTL